MRSRYIVRLVLADGSSESSIVWAESPEHAIKKAKSKLPHSLTVQRATANVEDEDGQVD